MTHSTRITVRIADDGMSASVELTEGEAAEPAQLALAIASAGVVFGVDEDACTRVQSALPDPAQTVAVTLIAFGAPRILGSDGYFSPAFEPGIQPGHVDPDGKMDFRERELLKPVQAGAHLGFLHPAIPGQPGTRVDGQPVPVPAVREAPLALGPGVLRAPEGRLSAAVEGVILFVPRELLDVVREHAHRGDVDLRSGNLAMSGSLRVQGNVTRLFEVRATGDIEITGAVWGGSAHAGGSLAVRGVVQGGSTGMLSARGDLRARSAERTTLHSRGTLKLESAVHCELVARAIEVGALRGGRALAEELVFARELGLANGTETTVAAGQPLPQQARDDVLAAVADAKSGRVRTRARGSADNAERVRGAKGGRARPSLFNLERVLAMRFQRDELLHKARVIVQAVAQPGVTVQLGEATLTLTRPVSATCFTYHAPTRSIRSERYVP